MGACQRCGNTFSAGMYTYMQAVPVLAGRIDRQHNTHRMECHVYLCMPCWKGMQDEVEFVFRKPDWVRIHSDS